MGELSSSAYNPYLILAVIFLAGIAAPINPFKLPPLKPQVLAGMQTGLTGSGWLMSVFALAGVIFALPSGSLLRRFGPRLIGVVSMGLILAGSVICAFSATMPVIMAGRVLGGGGMGLYSGAASAALSPWFRPPEPGSPRGL